MDKTQGAIHPEAKFLSCEPMKVDKFCASKI